MDRNNLAVFAVDVPTPVALRKESVDRNIPAGRYALLVNMSLSARRAWIEI